VPEPPYDVTAWSLGMLLGVRVDFSRPALPASLRLSRVEGTPKLPGGVDGRGPSFGFAYNGADTAIAINRLLRRGAAVSFDRPSHVRVSGIDRGALSTIASDASVTVTTEDRSAAPDGQGRLHAPRIGVYAPWTGDGIDEGWTRWVLEQYEFGVSTLHNDDIRAGMLRDKFDAIILPDQSPTEILEGFSAPNIRPEFRGGMGSDGFQQIAQFVVRGGTLVTLGASCDVAIERLSLPVQDVKRTLRRDQHFAPGSILSVRVDAGHPIGYGMAAETYGFYDNSPFFALDDSGPGLQVVARYADRDVLASGYLKGEEAMAGQAAVVSIDIGRGHVVLFGLRPQHRGQTHATFPMLFNALYLAAADRPTVRPSQ
jgi:hypothetical protein